MEAPRGIIERYQHRRTHPIVTRAVNSRTCHLVDPRPGPFNTRTPKESPAQPADQAGACRTPQQLDAAIYSCQAVSSSRRRTAVLALNPTTRRVQTTKLGTITVLMPAKNAASTILRAANTTLRALPRDGKLLVLDDASTDGTGELVKGIRDRRVQVLSSDQPLGVAQALNELLNSADSEFVARMDADDVTLPSRFSTQSRSLSRGLDVTFGGVVHFGESLGLAYPSPPCPLHSKAFNIALLIGNPVAHSTMLARRAALVETGGYATGLAEDYELWMRMTSQGHALGRSALPVVALRRHPGQVTARDSWSERAQLETFWQASYRELARVVLGEDEVARHSGPLDRANAPVDKARVLSKPLLEVYATLNGVDRLGVQLLARRSGFILREGRS